MKKLLLGAVMALGMIECLSTNKDRLYKYR